MKLNIFSSRYIFVKSNKGNPNTSVLVLEVQSPGKKQNILNYNFALRLSGKFVLFIKQT